ncbi:MAG TPA: Mpo1-like protein [Arachidicoccus sp.]
MKTIQQWLDEYAVSHQNHTNKLIHWICVPAIFWTIVALLYSIPNPFVEITAENAGWAEGIFAKIALLLVTVYYGVLSVKLAGGMLIYTVICLAISHEIYKVGGSSELAIIAVIVFVIAWIFQFVGHNIEGKKPSFLKDLQYLMIGPAWIMSFIYGKMGIKF